MWTVLALPPWSSGCCIQVRFFAIKRHDLNISSNKVYSKRIPTRGPLSTAYVLWQHTEPAYARIIMMTMTTLTFEYDHIHPRLFSIQRLLSAGHSHPDNMSLMLAIRSIELARYLSGIMSIVLLFSSSNCCTRVNVSPNARSL